MIAEMALRAPQVWAELSGLDQVLLADYERAWRDGAARAGRRLACRRGCIPCCVGAFEITPLDALRLAAGFAELAWAAPGLARTVRRRAMRAWSQIEELGSGVVPPGALPAEQLPREQLLQACSSVPCPAVSRRSGRCLLYSWRPLSCRSYGLPLACGVEILPPCSLNLEGVPPESWARFAIEPDPDDMEGELLARIQELAPGAGDTTVAGAVAQAGNWQGNEAQ